MKAETSQPRQAPAFNIPISNGLANRADPLHADGPSGDQHAVKIRLQLFQCNGPSHRRVQMDRHLHALQFPDCRPHHPARQAVGRIANDEFVFLSRMIGKLLLDFSDEIGLVYFETEYFGGEGLQGAALARGGKLIFGPECGDPSINLALRAAAVYKNEERDEFDAF